MNKNYYELVAEVVRVEYEKDSNDVYLVFKITNEKFKQQIKQNWMKDIDLKIIDKNLYKFPEEFDD